MRAYEIGDYASTGRLRVVERPDPAPGAGEALIRVRATGPNARDYSIMRGVQFGRAVPPTRIPLSDNAGDVLAVGSDVTAVRPGDRVTLTHYWRWLDGAWQEPMRESDFAMTLDGFLAEQAVVPAEALLRIPNGISYDEACTLQSAGLTAWNAVVEAGGVQPGQTVVTIGTGGVSVFALQWAKLRGARVIVTSSSDEKLGRMRELGADEGVNYRETPKWSEAVCALTGGRGADLVVNNVGMSELDECLESCASGGRVAYVGANAVDPSRTSAEPAPLRRLGLLIIRDLTPRGVIVGSRRMFGDLLAAMDESGVRPVIDRVFSFEDANEALAYAAGGEKLGKVVIRIP